MPIDIKNISDFQQMLNQVLKHNDILDVDVCKQIEASLTKATRDISEAVANNVLFKLHEKETNHDYLEALISIAPSALFVKNEKGLIPLQQAYTFCYNALDNSLPYVGFLAKEGVKYDDNNTRGGLLLEDPTSNPKKFSLQCLTTYRDTSNVAGYDLACVKVLKELKDSGLLTAQDIRDYNLFYWACRVGGQSRFQFLSDMDPEGLKMFYEGKPLFHSIIQERSTTSSISLFLRAALKHHPKDMGLLFLQLDDDNETVFEKIISKHGKDAAFKIVCENIPQDTHLPILHHIVKFAPCYFDDFAYYYHDTGRLRDNDGRTLFQVKLEYGIITLKTSAQMLLFMNPKEIEEIDPATNLYPFMVAASSEKSDLDTTYYLLRRKPSLACGEEVTACIGRKKRRSKRLKLSCKMEN